MNVGGLSHSRQKKYPLWRLKDKKREEQKEESRKEEEEVIASSFSFLSLRHLVIGSSINREWRKAAILAWNTNARDLNFNTKIWESGIVDSVIMNDRYLPLRALRIQRLRQRCSGCKISSVFVLSSSMSRIVEPEQADFGPLILPLCPTFLYRCLHSLNLSRQYFNAGNMNCLSLSLSSMQALPYPDLSDCNINERLFLLCLIFPLLGVWHCIITISFKLFPYFVLHWAIFLVLSISTSGLLPSTPMLISEQPSSHRSQCFVIYTSVTTSWLDIHIFSHSLHPLHIYLSLSP